MNLCACQQTGCCAGTKKDAYRKATASQQHDIFSVNSYCADKLIRNFSIYNQTEN